MTVNEILRGKMYRTRGNYIRFGQRHIFINFNEDNLDDLNAINTNYGKGPRTKNGTTMWSGEIHIFIDYIAKSSSDTTGTLEVLRIIKNAYGGIFKIHLHLYPPIVCKKRNNLSKIAPEYKDGFDKLVQCAGSMHIMKHADFDPISFEEGFTEITICRNCRKDVAYYGQLKVTTTMLADTKIHSCRHFEPFLYGPVWSHDHRRYKPR